MPEKKSVFKIALWGAVFTSLIVLMSGAVLLAVIVGDWIVSETHSPALAWGMSLTFVFGCVLALGFGFGLFIYWRYPKNPPEPPHITDSMEILLTESVQRKDRD